MGRELRAIALRAGVLGVIVACVIGGGVAMALLSIQDSRLRAGNSAFDSLIPIAAWSVTVAVCVVAMLWVSVLVVERRAHRLTEPMRQLANRAEEYGSGGFSLDPVRDSDGPAEPLISGVQEIDTVSQILDSNTRSLVRALSSERSFAADASHQLRTPLAALLMRLEEIMASEDLAEIRAEAEVAITQTERLAGVVDDLLHRSRAGHADGGRSVSVDTVLTQLQREWGPAFHAEGREIEVGVERGMIVRSSASAIGQILDTLVENALAHGGGKVQVTARRSGPSAILEIRDEGPGVPDELAAKVFDRAVTGGSGTGLGLSVARQTAESFGGRLELTRAKPAVFALYVSMASAG